MTARADTFGPTFPVVPMHSVGAGNTAGSFAASAMMGAKGHSNLAPLAGWESSITSLCATKTGGSVWPGGCNPTGMASALVSLTSRSWVQALWTDTQQALALNAILGALQGHGSPAVVPIYGQADHWVAVTSVVAMNSGGTWTVQQLKFYDGGPVDGIDGGFNSYQDGLVSYSANVFKTVYFRVLENINPGCDPCTTDPWYNKFVVMWEPPVGEEHNNPATTFVRAPGVAPIMTELKAQQVVWQSLMSAGVDQDAEIWGALQGGVAGKAFEVNGVAPNGDRWDYYLVPIIDGRNQVKGLVQLDAEDGAYQSAHVPSHPSAFAATSRAQAEALARGALGKGEALTAGILTWDPRAKTPFAKAPTFPYYEFGVVNASKEVAVVRVSFNKGIVSRVSR